MEMLTAAELVERARGLARNYGAERMALEFHPEGRETNKKLLWAVTADSFVLANAGTFARQEPCSAAGIERHLSHWERFALGGTVAVAEIPREGWAGAADLKPRGWTESMIVRFLGEPGREIANVRHPRGPKVRQWRWADVERAERAPEFAEAKAGARRRSDTSAAAAQKRAEARAEQARQEAAALAERERAEALAEIVERIGRMPIEERHELQLSGSGGGLSGDTYPLREYLGRELLDRAGFEWTGRTWAGPTEAARAIVQAFRQRKAALAPEYAAQREAARRTRQTAAEARLAAEQERQRALEAQAVYIERRGQGNGGFARDVGDTFLSPHGDAVTVYHAERIYVREDGFSFGVGDDSGYIYTHYCRAATPEEEAGLRARLAERQRLQQAQDRWADLKRQLQAEGWQPAQARFGPGARRVLDTQTLYGGGDWFVVDRDGGRIWYVRNNGADGDDWSRNNVQTQGAGAIGWGVAWTAELEAELLALDEVIRLK